MKIINGKFSGRNFYMPLGIRPTQNIVRKAVFDIIGHDLSGLSFLDLFAGSGAMGFEALSCGAQEVCLVEKDPKCVKVIEENLELLNPAKHAQRADVVMGDAFRSIKEFAACGRCFDIVFFDPPFGLTLGKKILKTLTLHDILSPHSFVVAQCDLEDKLSAPEKYLALVKEKVYGASRLSLFERLQEQGEV